MIRPGHGADFLAHALDSAHNVSLEAAVENRPSFSKPEHAMLVADLDTLPLRPSVRTALREAKTALERLYGERLVKVILFGSHARGEAHRESDVDVLVVLHGAFNFSEEVKRTSVIASKALLNHHELLALLPFAASRLGDPSDPLIMNVREEGVEL